MADQQYRLENYGDAPEAVLERLAAKHDAVGMATLLTLLRIESDMHENGWDEPPRLFTLRKEMIGEPELGEAAEGLEGILVAVREIGSAIFAGFNGEQIAGALQHVAANVPDWIKSETENLVAMALLNEGYIAISTADQDDENFIAPADHPDRQEIRFLLCADIVGAEYQVIRVRESDTVVVLHTDATDQDEQSFRIGGRITDGLRALVEAVL